MVQTTDDVLDKVKRMDVVAFDVSHLFITFVLVLSCLVLSRRCFTKSEYIFCSKIDKMTSSSRVAL